MNIDLISQVCIFTDFPIWKATITKYRDKFNKVILYPSRHHGVIDLEEFWKKVFPETWAEPVEIDWSREDWRQAEVTPCLTYSNSEWIWFTEADFFVKDWDKFFSDIEGSMQRAEMIGWWNETQFPYIHPCCLFIKRELLEKTNKDFTPHPEIPGADHFSMITRDVERLGAKIIKLQNDLGYKEWEDAFHGGGYTYPYQNWKGDGTDVFGVGRPEVFYAYNYMSRLAKVEQSPFYLDLSYKVEKHMERTYGYGQIEINKWKGFFE